MEIPLIIRRKNPLPMMALPKVPLLWTAAGAAWVKGIKVQVCGDRMFQVLKFMYSDRIPDNIVLCYDRFEKYSRHGLDLFNYCFGSHLLLFIASW